jgi:hypothetical protein
MLIEAAFRESMDHRWVCDCPPGRHRFASTVFCAIKGKDMKVSLPLLLAIANGLALAQGPISPDLAPLKYKLLFENDEVRVIEEHLKPREKEAMHSHPYGVFACFLSDAHTRTTFPDGSTSEDSKKAGDTIWRDPVTHAGENIGNTEIHEIMIELKSASQGSGSTVVPSPPISPGQPMPASQEPHHHVRYENRYIRILEVLLEPGVSSFFHTHSNDILYITLADAVARAQEQYQDWGPETALRRERTRLSGN